MYIVAMCWIVSFDCFIFWQLNILTLVSCEWLVSCQKKSFSFLSYYIWRSDLFYVCLIQKSPQEKPLFWCSLVPWGGKDVCHFFPFPVLCLPLQLIKIQEDFSSPQSQVADLIKELLWWYLDKLLLSCASVCGKLALLHKDKWCDSLQQFIGLFIETLINYFLI